MPMRFSVFIGFLIGIQSTLMAETITGRIVNNATPAIPIANAAVGLQVKGISVYTSTPGQFTLSYAPAAVRNAIADMRNAISMNGPFLLFTTIKKEPLQIDLYDMDGRRIKTLVSRSFDAGCHTLSIPALMAKSTGVGCHILRIRKGGETLFRPFLSTGENSGSFAVGNAAPGAAAPGISGMLATASVDSVAVYRMGYIPRTLPIASYATQDLGDIVLTQNPAEVAVERKADSLLGLMTLTEKAEQMVQAQINSVSDAQIASGSYGSVFNGGEEPVSPNTAANWATRLDQIQTTVLASSRLKIPIIYGIDAVHGNAKVAGCTVFPHNIALGCTHDTALVADMARVTAAECAAVGVHLTFAPTVAVVRNERWGRTYEGFGETPEINAMMGAAYVRALQGDGDMTKTSAIAACVKHFLGDGGTDNGANGGTVSVGDATMRAVHLPPYAAAARENMATVMPSYNSWTHNGQTWKQSVDTYTMTTILKQELGFDGFCLSDYDAIPQACGTTSSTYSAACVAQSINAGMDMAMIPGDNTKVMTYVNAIVSGVNGNTIPLARVNDAVKRILRVKFRMNLFGRPKSDAALLSQVFSAAHQLVARKCVQKSLVLLKNDGNALPLGKTEKIVVVGPWADNMGAQCGGWTIGWQGATTYTNIAGQTILAGLQSLGSNVTYDASGANLANADKIVVVVGENPYAEGYGDVTVPDFSTCPNANLIQTCYNSGKPVILVMITGRPMLIDTELGMCKAIVEAWLPGSEGAGVADVLFDVVNFTGTLTHTWPASAAQIPINTGTAYADEQHGNGGTPLFPYGFGLHY